MGMIHADLDVWREGSAPETVRFLIDSGATYSVLPRPVWKRLGLEAMRSMDFSLADGSLVTRKVSGCWFRYGDVKAPSPVVLGGRHDVAILGTVTLESLGLVLHPFERTIEPWRRPPL